jgi:hypothetical protein
MKLLRTVVAALALVALLVPTIGLGDERPIPLEKKISAGTSTITYMGQTLRFTTAVPLLVKCDAESAQRFKMTVTLYPGTPLPNGPNTYASETLNIYWSNFGTDVYDGTIPVVEPWTGWLNTEGGFVDR